jgi:hypothetical protein
MKKLIRKYYDLATIVHSLKQVYFGKHIDNLLVYMIGLISNLYFIPYYIDVQYLIPTV